MLPRKWSTLLGILLLAFAMLAGGCGAKTVKQGDVVKVRYVLTLEDGTVYYTSAGREPLEVTTGKGQLIPGLEEALIGMRVGDNKTVTVRPEKAYGQRRTDLVQEVSRDLLPENFEPVVGKQIQTTLAGTPVMVIITELTDSTVTVDANAPLAGKNLTFQIELLSIKTPTPGRFAGQPLLVWVLSAALLAVTTAFVLYVIFSRRRHPPTPLPSGLS